MGPIREHQAHTSSISEANATDLSMVAAISSGCVDSWQRFIVDYTGLMLKVLRQILFLEEEDEVHDVYVRLLEDLRDRKLGKYEGNARLSTWLVFVARGYALDYVRQKRGRPRPPVGYDRLTEREKLVYRWHFVQGASFHVILELLSWASDKTTIDELVSAIQHIEELIDRRTLVRLDQERAARRAGNGSWREMQFFLQVRLDYLSRSEADGSDVLAGVEMEELRRRIDAAQSVLLPEERKVLELRFGEGLNAREIAKRVGWATPRRVYSVIESALVRLRRQFDPSRE